MKQTLTDLVLAAYRRAVEAGDLPDADLPAWKIELPKNPDHGDYAANTALVLASAAKQPPRKIAETLVRHLGDGGGAISGCEIAGPGFINFRLSPSVWRAILPEIEAAGDTYGHVKVGSGKKIQVEFVSANPTGPLHVGHGRGAAVGDVLARILSAAGYTVDREYYVNDAGNQIATLGKSVYLRYLGLLGRQVEFPETCYQGGYIGDIANDVLAAEGARLAELPEAQALAWFGDYAGSRILREIAEDLKEFGVEFDRWYSEKSLYDRGEVARSLAELEAKGVAYRHEGALWMRTTGHGDEKDRVLVRADGRETYFASDIAYHLEKFQRGYDEVIDVWGADHHGYVPRVKAALAASGIDPQRLDVLMVQFVTLLREGNPVSMSTRSGEFVTLEEVRKEVGRDAARFFFLSRSCDAPLDFDLEVAKRQTADNPVFYVQYAVARISSVLREAKASGVEKPPAREAPLDRLALDEEIDLLKHLRLFPEVVENAALQREPHRLAYYLLDLAGKFHPYYNKHRFLTDDAALSTARLVLIDAIRTTIRNGLGLLGVSAPETM